jgi:hypothetical protein
MSDYRCYCLDRLGCIRAVRALEADGDEGARASALMLLTTCGLEIAEIWDGRRRVCIIERRRHEQLVATRPPRRHRIAPAPSRRDAAEAVPARDVVADRGHI